jgi:hypothetical protein
MPELFDGGTGSDDATMAGALAVHDAATWRCDWDLAFYTADVVAEAERELKRAAQGVDFTRLGIGPSRLMHVGGNLLTTAGVTRIIALLSGTGQALTNTSGRIGVGNSLTTPVVGDTDLNAAAGSSNRQFAILDATFPTLSVGTITCQATFATGVANFTWNEIGIDIGAPTVSAGTTVSACLLNHKLLPTPFTKTAGLSIVCTATITIA